MRSQHSPSAKGGKMRSSYLFMDMSFQEMAAVREMMGSDHTGGWWGQNTALWAIVAIIIVVALIWFCHRSGKDKADLAASIQGLYGKVNAIEPVVARNVENISALNSVTSATTQAVGDFKQTALRNLNALDEAVFVSRCGGQRSGCGCNDSRFVKTSVYTPSTTSVEQIETCC